MKAKFQHLFSLLAVLASVHQASAQGTAFTYQGQLQNNGSPANGSYDFTFSLFNNSSTNTGQVGGTLTNLDAGVTNGLFTVTLDFGAVFTGNATWLAIGVRTNGGASFTALNPLQELTPAPYAIYAPNAGSAATATTAATAGSATSATSATTATTADNFSGSLAGNVTGTQNATVVATVGGVTAANVASGASAANAATSVNTPNTIVQRDSSGNFTAGTVTANLAGNAALAGNVVAGINITNAFITNAIVTNSVFAGNGGGLTNLNANNLSSGTVPLAQLSGITSNQLNAATWQLATNLNGGNAALASNVVAGINITNAFITNAIVTNSVFAGNGGGLTNLNANNLSSGTVPLAQLSGITSNQLNAATWQLATNLNGGNAALASNVVTGINITNAFITNAIVTNSVFGGNGGGLTNLNANNLFSGTVPLAQLSGITSSQLNAATWQLATNLNGGNAALASNVVTGINITNAFITNAIVTNSVFAGNGGGLTNLHAATLTGANALPVGVLPANVAFLNSNETFTANTITLAGSLVLPATTDTIYSGSSTLFHSDGNDNFFAGAGAGNLTLSGNDNAGVGFYALHANTDGEYNTAVGAEALYYNTDGLYNTAVGAQALQTNDGWENTAVGGEALQSITDGSGNTALGFQAGADLTSGDFNIDIGNMGESGDGVGGDGTGVIRIGTQGNQAATYIAGIYNTTVSTGTFVMVNSSGQLGVISSSRKFKQDIQNMADASDKLLALRPVTFKYKPEIEAQGLPQFGLIAEEVEQVDPNLVVHDKDHGIYTVRYEAVNAMLLNEFLKEHRKVETQDTEIQNLKQQNESLAGRLNELEAAVKALAERK